MRGWSRWFMAAAAWLIAGGAAAQAPAVRVNAPPAPTVNPAQQMAPAPGLPVQRGLAPATEQLQNLAPGTSQRVTSVAIEGATIIERAELDAMVSGLVGPSVPTKAIEDARLALLKRYRENGYPLVTVSATLTAAGRLRYAITEGRIAEVLLDGDIGAAGTKVLDFLNNLVKPGPVNATQLERWLLLAQDVPGVALQTVLRPSESEPGALTLVARVTRSAITGLVAADNRAFKDSGPEQVLFLAGYNSLTSMGERTEISLYRSMLNPTQIFGQASFEMFLGSSGLKLKVYGGAGDSRPGGILRQTNFDGVTTIAGMQVSYPLIYTRPQKLNIIGAFDLIQSDVFTGNPTPTSKDGLRVIRVGIDYALQDLWLGDARPAVNQANVRISRGLGMLGASHNRSQTLARLDSVVDYTKITAELSRNQTLYSFGPDTTLNLLTLVAGQASRDIIAAAEKFYLGGMRFTRGFYAGEVTGDNALAASAELQLNTVFQFDLFGAQREVPTQFYSFYDWGSTWENKKTDANKRLASFGIGTRATLTQNIEVDLEVVQRLTRRVDAIAGAVKPLPERAFYWRIVGRF